ncbi:unnamed protein product [Alopecurus aequalis]
MSVSSSSRSALRRRGPYIPLIKCETCGRVVSRKVSKTDEHDGWIFFRCEKHGHGCNFWHWELEYVFFLVENGYLTGDEGIEAVGWAEDRREELGLRKAEIKAISPGNDEKLQVKLTSIEQIMKEVMLLLKMVLVCVALLVLVMAVKK